MNNDISAAVLYGKGVFTTIAVIDRLPFLWEKHWQRLVHNSGKLEIGLGLYSEDRVRSLVENEIERASLDNGRVRITVYDQSPAEIWSDDEKKEPIITVISGDLRIQPEKHSLTVSPYLINSTSPLAGIKSCNYLEPLVCLKEARDRGSNEAVRMNEQSVVTSAAMANIFWVIDDELFTPPLSTGCLAGTTREYILDNLKCREVEITIDDLKKVDSIYLTSSGIGVISVDEFDGRKLAGKYHTIMHVLPY